jgi:hypothetical protein
MKNVVCISRVEALKRSECGRLNINFERDSEVILHRYKQNENEIKWLKYKSEDQTGANVPLGTREPELGLACYAYHRSVTEPMA